jgi:hypothetical protein
VHERDQCPEHHGPDATDDADRKRKQTQHDQRQRSRVIDDRRTISGSTIEVGNLRHIIGHRPTHPVESALFTPLATRHNRRREALLPYLTQRGRVTAEHAEP